MDQLKLMPSIPPIERIMQMQKKLYSNFCLLLIEILVRWETLRVTCQTHLSITDSNSAFFLVVVLNPSPNASGIQF